MHMESDDVLKYLRDHPGWHYGLDLVKHRICNRSTVYIHLGTLVELGYVEQRSTDDYMLRELFARHQYRYIGKIMKETLWSRIKKWLIEYEEDEEAYDRRAW